MKKIIFISVLFILPFFPDAQVWNWAKAGTNGVNGDCDPIDITTDRSGGIYETGIFTDTTFFDSISLATGDGGQQDAYLVKFDNSGNPLWAVAPVLFSATSGQAWGFSVSTGKTGNVCLAGAYWDTMRINSFFYPPTDIEQFFLATFSSSGTFLWGAYSQPAVTHGLGYPSSVVIDDSNNTYLTGAIRDSVYIGSKHVYGGPTPSGSFFLARFDTSGNIKWCITSASGSPSKGLSVVTDRTGNVYVAGDFFDSLTIGSTTIKSPRSYNEFIAEFNSSGDLIWLSAPTLPSSSSYISDLYSLPARVMSIDSIGNLYVTGCFKDTAQFGSYTLITQKLAVFIAKYSPAGNVIWAQQSTHAEGGAVPYSISCDRHSNFYLCGVFADSIEFKTVALKDFTTQPAFLYKFDSAGNPLCASAVNNQNDDPNTLTANPLAGGVFFSADIPAPSSCSFGSFLLTGEWGEYEFVASWSCDSVITTGIKEQIINGELRAYPNPCSTTLNITTETSSAQVFENQTNISSIQVSDITGRVLLTYNLPLTTYNYRIDVSPLSRGMYFLRINSTKGIETKKFIKE